MKRYLRTLLTLGSALCGLALCQGMTAFAEYGQSEDGLWNYNTYEDGTVSVSLIDKTAETADVPEKVNGMTVTMVEVDCFNGCENLKTVTLPDTITVIEDYSFYNCTALESISIPRNVKNIGFQAFYGCTSLEELRIPAGTDDIEAFAFEGCNSLKGIYVSDGNHAYKDEDGILFDYDGTTLILYPSANPSESYTVPEGCTEIYDYAFIGNSYLKSVDISGITKLGEDAFYYCTALESVEIPESITELNGSVFGNCTALQSIGLPSGLQTIGSGCFYSCMNLTGIDIPETVTSIGEYAFFNCPLLKEIRLTKNTASIGAYALGFYYSNTEQLERVPGFKVDAMDDTAAFTYCVENSIRCTGGITQGSVFIYIIVGVIVLVILAVIGLIIMQKKIQKRYELS